MMALEPWSGQPRMLEVWMENHWHAVVHFAQ
jgi:hypothetical protein